MDTKKGKKARKISSCEKKNSNIKQNNKKSMFGRFMELVNSRYSEVTSYDSNLPKEKIVKRFWQTLAFVLVFSVLFYALQLLQFYRANTKDIVIYCILYFLLGDAISIMVVDFWCMETTAKNGVWISLPLFKKGTGKGTINKKLHPKLLFCLKILMTPIIFPICIFEFFFKTVKLQMTYKYFNFLLILISIDSLIFFSIITLCFHSLMDFIVNKYPFNAQEQFAANCIVITGYFVSYFVYKIAQKLLIHDESKDNLKILDKEIGYLYCLGVFILTIIVKLGIPTKTGNICIFSNAFFTVSGIITAIATLKKTYKELPKVENDIPTET